MAQERSDMTGSEMGKLGEEELAEVPSREIDLSATEDKTSDEAEKIKDQIENTRAQMGETIDAIQERLSFENISDQVSEHVNNAVATAKGAVYDATVGKVGIIMRNIGNEISETSIGKTVVNNPLPFILIGAGAGILAYQAYNGKLDGRSRGRSLSSQANRQLTGGVNASESMLSSVTDTVSGTIGGVKDSVASAAGTAYEKVTDAVDQTYRKAGEFGHTAREQYDHYLEENPLAVGAVALALGAAVGLAIPATRYEGKLMGQAKQDLLNKAQDTATNLLHETRESVGDAGRSFADKAKASIEH
jgi:ElaB/YqjD/DUF883 family membrane-anchored ribosome-binding protein